MKWVSHDHRHPPVVELPRKAHETLAAAGVQHRRGLVQHQYRRVHGKHPGDSHPLLLAAGKRRGLTTVEALQPHFPERSDDPLLQLVGGHAQVLRPEGHVVFHYACHQLVVGVLEHHARMASDVEGAARVVGLPPQHRHAPRVGQQQRVDVPGQRGLARSVAPQDAQELAPGNGQVHVAQHEGLAVVGEAHLLEGHRRRGPPGFQPGFRSPRRLRNRLRPVGTRVGGAGCRASDRFRPGDLSPSAHAPGPSSG